HKAQKRGSSQGHDPAREGEIMPRPEAASRDPQPNARRCFGSRFRDLWLCARGFKQCRLVLLLPFGAGPAHIVALGMVRLAESSHLIPSPIGAPQPQEDTGKYVANR